MYLYVFIMLTKNQLPGLPGSTLKVFCGWFAMGQPIDLSLPTQVESELSFDNIKKLE